MSVFLVGFEFVLLYRVSYPKQKTVDYSPERRNIFGTVCPAVCFDREFFKNSGRQRVSHLAAASYVVAVVHYRHNRSFSHFRCNCSFSSENRGLGRNSIKQAFDTLPSAVCYFAPSGIVKLCNFQMHRLFRTLAQSDLQTFNELQQALKECDGKSGVIKLSDERQTYLFPDGTVWRYAQTEVTAPSIGKYTETIFFDVTKLYEKNLQLKAQTKQLKKISLKLKFLSDNVLTLTKEKEVLAAKTKLHDQMGAGMIAVRRMLQHKQTTKDIVEAIRLFRKAVNMMKIDNENPLERSELAEFMHDADAIGVKIILTGEMPEQTEVYNAFIVVMRECLTNGVCHAGATELQIDIRQDDSSLSMRITNNGTVPKGEIVPKGGLKNMEHYIINLQGTVKIQSSPVFALTVTVPFAKEGM